MATRGVPWWASPEDAQAHFKAELFRDWGFAAARARAEALMEALPGSSFGKKTQARSERGPSAPVPSSVDENWAGVDIMSHLDGRWRR